MSDSDDDYIVRYGTQLEPYEEDCTSAMPKPITELPKSAKKRFRKLIALNVNVKKARELCQLTWTEIFKIIPGIESIVLEMPDPLKKFKKKHTLKAGSQQEHQLTERRSREESDQSLFWHNPCNTSPDRSRSPNFWGPARTEQSHLPNQYETAKESLLHQPYRSPQTYTEEVSHSLEWNYWEEAGPSHARDHEINRRKRRLSEGEPNWKSSHKVMKISGVNSEEENYCGRDRSSRTRDYSPRARDRSPRTRDRSPRTRDRSPRTRDRSPRPRDCSSRTRDRSPRTRDGSQRMREHSPRTRARSPRMRSRHDPIPKACSSKHSYERPQLEYIDADDALQVQVHNGMRAVKFHYNERNDEKPFSDQPCNAQKTSSEGGASFNYWSEPDRPSRLGLRNETHPPNHGSTYSYSEDKRFREDPKNYQKISWENNVNLEYRESDRPSRDGLRNESHPIATICIEDSDEEYSGPIYEPHTPVDDDNAHFDFNAIYRKEPKSEKGSLCNQETRETLEDKDANADKGGKPIRIGIRNITPMTKTQMTLVHQSINQAIVQIGVQGAGPKFSGSTFKAGWILMICENHKSRKWLEQKVPTLKPWPEASLSITQQDHLLKPITLSILIRDKEGITVSTALELLRVQNPGLKTNLWKVYNVMKVYSGQVVHLSVDVASFETLKLIHFKANLGMDKVSFWIRSKPKKRGLLVKPSEKVPLLPTPCASIEGPNKDSDCSAAESITKKVRRRPRHRKAHATPSHDLSETIDTKPSLMAQVKESKSPPSETWKPKSDQSFAFDQSYCSSDWINW